VEWSKAFARACRFSEEEALVLEEMRRVRRYFIWKSSWWHSQETGAGTDKVTLGKKAYALKQANMWDQLLSKFLVIWKSELSYHKLQLDLLEV
jgi:Ser/Thr protein kinase RdoA (MazF antagonist)